MNCLVCGKPVTVPPWWKRIFTGTFPFHKGDERDQCWRDFLVRTGADPDSRPRPL